MLTRQDKVKIFSTFIQFDRDRFGGWATDPRLLRSMKQTLNKISGENSDSFWALYWHQIWQEKPESPAREHLAAYLQEVCFWSATKTVSSFSNSQYTVPDYFQIAIARLDKVLKGFDRERGFNLKSYASITFSNLIRELLRQKREIDICSEWSLLRKVSQKMMGEALTNTGLDWEKDKYILAWNCYKTIYIPEKPSSTRKLAKPKLETWKAIANLYNQERSTQLKQSVPAKAGHIEEWMLVCAKAIRSYLFPSVTSINQPKPGHDTGEIADSIVGEVDNSLLTEMITDEEVQQRSQQRTDINQFLSSTIEKLKPEEQKLLELYYSLGFKQAEIAQKLNIQQYTVSRKLSKVRKTLLKALAKWTKETMHITLTSDVLNNISSLLEEWLADRYDNQK